MRARLILAAATLASLMPLAAAMAAGPEVPFPAGYRSWTHISSAWIGEGGLGFPRFGGMHHIYANPAAVQGYRTGTFPAGSVLVFDVLETKQANGAITTGARKFRDVMAKTGDGWRFTEFNLGSQTERNVATEAGDKACGACHASATTDHVFSSFADGAEK
jgi:hypothetical protein